MDQTLGLHDSEKVKVGGGAWILCVEGVEYVIEAGQL